MLKQYIRLMRLDHWIKNIFVVPGVIVAFLLVENVSIDIVLLFKMAMGVLSTCFISSANYVINEWLDAPYDKYHPKKKHRAVVENNLEKKKVYLEYCIVGSIGLVCSCVFVGVKVFAMEAWLLFMGILYNVPPIRLKDIPILDVLSESVNSLIRLLIGWFSVTEAYLPPVSIVICYWMVGAFLMNTKRFSEYRMISDKEIAISYRKSFAKYSERNLICASLFYACVSIFLLGIFLLKYRIEYLILIPIVLGLFCYYLYLSYEDDSSVQSPEKLYKEKGIIFYVTLICIVAVILSFIDIPNLRWFLNQDLMVIK